MNRHRLKENNLAVRLRDNRQQHYLKKAPLQLLASRQQLLDRPQHLDSNRVVQLNLVVALQPEVSHRHRHKVNNLAVLLLVVFRVRLKDSQLQHCLKKVRLQPLVNRQQSLDRPQHLDNSRVVRLNLVVARLLVVFRVQLRDNQQRHCLKKARPRQEVSHRHRAALLGHLAQLLVSQQRLLDRPQLKESSYLVVQLLVVSRVPLELSLRRLQPAVCHQHRHKDNSQVALPLAVS